jgi:hypothetical protein
MGQVSITNRAATQLALPVAGRSRMADPSGKNPIETNLYGVDSLKLGGVTFRGALAGALPDTLRRFEGVDGILGIALFTDFLLTFDYPRSELRLSRESLPDTNGRDILSFTREMGPIVVPLRIGNRLLPADVDTGNLIAPFVFPTAFVDSMPRRGEPRSGGTARTISNEVKIQVVTAAVPIRLGATVFENADVAYPALHERGNIGSKAFANSTLEIDQKNRRLRLRSSTAAGAGR